MVHQEKKKLAFRLRKEGKSYSEISKITGIPKGTLSGWLAPLAWSIKVSAQNSESSIAKSKKRIEEMNLARKVSLDAQYKKAQAQAAREFKIHKDNQYFIAGLMLYLGEGDKTLANHLVRISNADPVVLKIFNRFLKEFCAVPVEKIRFWALIYPDIDERACKSFWLEELGLVESNLYKFQVIQGRHTKKKLHYGVGNTILGNKLLKVKLLEWIRLAGLELSE